MQRTVLELSEGVNESASAFIDTAQAQQQQIESTNELADRYDVLSTQTSLNELEQRELDSIIQQLARNIPATASELDAYGKVVAINTGEVRRYNQTLGATDRAIAQSQLGILIEQYETLLFNQSLASGANEENIIIIKSLTEVFTAASDGIRLYNGITGVSTRATEEQVRAIAEYRRENEASLSATLDNINSLQSLLGLTISNVQTLDEYNASLGRNILLIDKSTDANNSNVDSSERQARNIPFLNSLIAKQRDVQNTLVATDTELIRSTSAQNSSISS